MSRRGVNVCFSSDTASIRLTAKVAAEPAQFERVRGQEHLKIPGTGLGMSLVKEITELQGGSVQIDSRPGEGTSVTLWWPCAAASQPLIETQGK